MTATTRAYDRGPILRYPGSKFRLARWIIGHLPPHRAYVEPFAGSLAVLLNKPRAALETVNDLDGDVVNLFRVLRDRPDELARVVTLTPWSREELEGSYDRADCGDLERARRFLVRCHQGIGDIHYRTGWRHALDARQNPARPWAALPDRLLAVAARLAGVHIEHRPALDVIARRAHVDCLLYCDPPYLHTTRPVARGSYKRQYTHEMDNADHAALLDALLAHPGPVLLSGYANPLYDERLAGWGRVERATLAETGARRTEILWSNPIAVARLHARQLAYMESI